MGMESQAAEAFITELVQTGAYGITVHLTGVRPHVSFVRGGEKVTLTFWTRRSDLEARLRQLHAANEHRLSDELWWERCCSQERQEEAAASLWEPARRPVEEALL